MSRKAPFEEANAFTNPTTVANRLRMKRSGEGGSVASGRRDKSRFKDPDLASVMSAISSSTSVKTKGSNTSLGMKAAKFAAVHQSQSRDEIASVESPRENASKSNAFRNFADVAGLGLHDTPPQGPVGNLPLVPVKGTIKKGDSFSDVDPELVRAIEKLVASKQGDASALSPSSDVATLTRQIEKLAESRRGSSIPLAPKPPPKGETPRPNPEAATRINQANARPPAATGRHQLDLKNNDNAFHVIADLVLAPFEQVEKGAALPASGRAQLDRSVPPHVRQGFVEAVQYRLENNCPPGSKEHIHVVTRKCQAFGFAKNDETNPLFEKSPTVEISNVKSATNLVLELNERISPKKKPGVGTVPKAATAVPSAMAPPVATESLAHQQLVAELEEASNFMAECKTKEAANFWRNHVLELQARLRSLHGESTRDNKDTDEDIREANRHFLGDSDPLSRTGTRYNGYVAPRGLSNDTSTDSGARFSQSIPSGSSYDTGSDSSSWRGSLMKPFSAQLVHLEKIYELIDLLIALLDLDKLLNFIEPKKLADLVNTDKLKKMLKPDTVRAFLEERGYGEYMDLDKLERDMDPNQYTELMEDLKNPETLRRLLDPRQFNEIFDPEQLRESMNFDKIRDLLSSPEKLKIYFEQQGLAQVWDLDKLREIMDANKLREALDKENIRQVLRSQEFRSFMGNTYRGPMGTVDVVAPATLPGGYKFEAEVDGHRFLATVPQGGVEQGETFSCEMRDIDTIYVEEIPVGGWRDRLCDCFTHGICHPVIWTSFFCPLLALGQIMTRMKLDFLGRRQAKDKHTFAVMSSILIMWGMMNLAIFAAFNYKWSQRIELSVADYCALGLINLSVLVFAMYATASTRATLREKYLIREHRCYDLEDCCCGTFCMPCTICQMARHTVDFKLYEAACCSETGLEEGSDIPLTGSERSGTNYFCADDSSGNKHFCTNKKGTNYFCADDNIV